MKGYSQYYRIFVPDTTKGLRIHFRISAGSLAVDGNFYDPNSDILSKDLVYKIPYMRGNNQWMICPASNPAFNGPSQYALPQSATFYFEITALESTVYSISMTLITPLTSTSLTDFAITCPQSSPCPVADSQSVYCLDGDCSGAGFMYTADKMIDANDACFPILVDFLPIAMNPHAISLSISRHSINSSEILSHSPSTSLFLCPGEVLYVQLPVFSGTAIFTISTQARFEVTALKDLEMYSAATSELMGTVVQHCVDGSGTNYTSHCGFYETEFCPFYLASLGQVDTLPWPPIPALSELISGWSEQATDQLSYLFLKENINPQSIQWIVWNSYRMVGDLQPTVVNPWLNLSCSWSLSPRLRSSKSLQTSSNLPHPVVREMTCDPNRLTNKLATMQNVVSTLLHFMDYDAMDKIIYVGGMQWYDDVFGGCYEVVESLYNHSEESFLIHSDVCLKTSLDSTYQTDPCCSFAPSLDFCCLPRDLAFSSESLVPNMTHIEETCSTTPDCIQSFLDEYVTWELGQFGNQSCGSIFQAAKEKLTESRVALATCSLFAFSSNQARTWSCQSDADCPRGRRCNFFLQRCDYNRSEMEYDFVDCLFGQEYRLSSFVIGAFVRSLGISLVDYHTEDGSLAKFIYSNYTNWDCVPSDELGLSSRRHYTYFPIEPDCWDYCDTTYDRHPSNPPSCLEEYCTLPLECTPPFAFCQRKWHFDSKTVDGCSAYRSRCNWFDVQNCQSDVACLSACIQPINNSFCGFCFDEAQLDCVDTGISLDQCSSYQVCAFPNGTVEIIPADQNCSFVCTELCQSPSSQSQYYSTNPNFPQFCFAESVTVNECNQIPGAQWLEDRQQGAEVCVLPQYPISMSCLSNGYSWASCSSPRADPACETIDSCVPFSSDVLSVLSCANIGQHHCPDEATCAAAGSCSDAELLTNRLQQPVVLGACVHPFSTDNPNIRCPRNDLIPSYLGCVDWNISSQIDCIYPSQWVTPLLRPDNQTCLATKVCSDASYRPLSECGACDLEYVSVFSWTQGQWVQSQSKPLKIIERKIVYPISWATSLDLVTLTQDITMYSDIDASFSNRAAFLCSSLPILKVEAAAAFGCPSNSSHHSDLPPSDFLDLIGIAVPCEGEQYSLLGPFFTISFNHLSLGTPAELVSIKCPIVSIESIQASLFRSPPAKPLASLFSKYPRQIPYEVENAYHQIVGQVVGDGITFTHHNLQDFTSNSTSEIIPIPKSNAEYEYFLPNYTVSYSELNSSLPYDPNSKVSSNVLICLNLVEALESTTILSWTTWDFARKEGDHLVPLLLNVTREGRALCTLLKELYYGDSFIPIKRVKDPFADQEPLFNSTELGIIYATSALYFIVLTGLFYRLAYLAYIGEFFSMQAIFPICLSIFDIFRGVYFSLLGSEKLVGISSAANFALIDIPYFFFFFGMSLLLWWWVSLVYTRDHKYLIRNFRLLMITSSLVFILLLTVVGILYQVLEQSPPISCNGRIVLQPSGLSNQDILLITEKSVFCFLALLGGLFFLITAQQLTVRAMKTVERQVIFITWIAFLSFFGQSLYFIILVVTYWSESAYSLIPLWFIEILPQPLMLYFQRATRTHSKRFSSKLSRHESSHSFDPHMSLQLTDLVDDAPPLLVYTGQDEQ